MKPSNFVLFLYGALIFLGGTAVGVMGHRLYSTNSVSAISKPAPDEWRKKFTADMKTKVGLSDEQMGKLNSTLDESKALFDQVRQKYHPEMSAIYDAQVTKIKAMLTPPQLEEYEKILEDQKASREKSAQK